MLSFVSGAVPECPRQPWNFHSRRALIEVAQLIRGFHDASVSFAAPTDAQWRVVSHQFRHCRNVSIVNPLVEALHGPKIFPVRSLSILLQTRLLDDLIFARLIRSKFYKCSVNLNNRWSSKAELR